MLRREKDDDIIFVPVAQMFPFYDQRMHRPGQVYGSYGTKHTDHPCFFVENAHSANLGCGETVLWLGFSMMADVNKSQKVLDQLWGVTQVKLHEEWAKLLETLIVQNWRMAIFGKGISWDHKCTPEMMVMMCP